MLGICKNPMAHKMISSSSEEILHESEKLQLNNKQTDFIIKIMYEVKKSFDL